jgi:hypothetical protein
MDKKPYLFCHDYGTGGLWYYFRAHEPNDVRRKYPILTYVEDEPTWLTPKDKERMLAECLDVVRHRHRVLGWRFSSEPLMNTSRPLANKCCPLGSGSVRPNKQLQRTVMDKVPSHKGQRAAAELRR